MERSFAELISNVPHFPVLLRAQKIYSTIPNTITIDEKTNEEIFKEFEEYSQPLARAFSLCTMHEINKIRGNA